MDRSKIGAIAAEAPPTSPLDMARLRRARSPDDETPAAQSALALLGVAGLGGHGPDDDDTAGASAVALALMGRGGLARRALGSGTCVPSALAMAWMDGERESLVKLSDADTQRRAEGRCLGSLDKQNLITSIMAEETSPNHFAGKLISHCTVRLEVSVWLLARKGCCKLNAW